MKKIKKKFSIVFAALLVAVAPICEAFASETAEFNRISALSNTEDNSGINCSVCGIVTHVSNIRDGVFILAAADKPYRHGIPVRLAKGKKLPAEGDEIWVKGRTFNAPERLAIAAEYFTKVNSIDLDFEQSVRYDRLRKGLLDLRRVDMAGTVISVSLEEKESGIAQHTVLRVMLDDAVALVRVPGVLKKRDYIKRPVRITGCVFPVPDESGAFATRVVEVARVEDIDFIDNKEGVWWLAAKISGLTVLLFALAAAIVAWLKSRRERLRIAAVVAERKRMAMDLHDTLEQHLACVRLLISSTLNNDVLPEAARETLLQAGKVLANAKVQVRDAVMNLRSDEALTKSPTEALNEIASYVASSGKVRCTCDLHELPERLSQRRYEDLLAIVREAITNAIKHGGASEIVISSSIHNRDGFELAVKNNGAPFDAKEALGPETGHFGLAGIFERAARSKFKASYSNEDGWTVLKLVTI